MIRKLKMNNLSLLLVAYGRISIKMKKDAFDNKGKAFLSAGTNYTKSLFFSHESYCCNSIKLSGNDILVQEL